MALRLLLGASIVGYRTSLAMIGVDKQFTVFGATGGLTFSALSGLLLHQLLPYRGAAGPRPAHAAIQGTP